MPAVLLRPAAWPLPGSLPPRLAAPRSGSGGFTLRNSFEGGTAATPITAGNSGGASGVKFDTASTGTGTTLNYDNSTTGHGSLSMQCATTATPSTTFVTWSTSFSNQGAGFGPAGCYFGFSFSPDAIPAVNARIWGCSQTNTVCAGVQILTTGGLRTTNAASQILKNSVTTLTPGAWYRLEGFMFGDPGNGTMELRIFTSVNATVPAEVLTSTGAALLGPPNVWRFGISGTSVANVAVHYDDLYLSSTGYQGPVGAFNAVTLPVTIATSGALADQVGKPLAASVATTGTVQDQVGKTLAGSVAATGTVTRSAGNTLAVTVAASGVLTRAASRAFAVSTGTAGALAQQMAKTLTGVATTAAALQNQAAKAFPAAAVTTVSLARNAVKTFPVTVAAAGVMRRGTGKLLQAVVSAVASFTGTQPPHIHRAVVTIAPYGPDAALVTIADLLPATVAVAAYGLDAARVTITFN